MVARRHLLAGAVAAAAWAGTAAARPARLPRTPDGKPDLSGAWSCDSGTPLERPGAFKTLVVSQAEAEAYERGERNVVHGIPGDDVGQAEAEWPLPNPPLARVRGEARTSLIVDPPNGRLPYSPAGRRAFGGQLQAMRNFDGPESRPSPERCLIGFGTPADAPLLNTPQTGGNYQFVHTPDFLVLRAEANHDVRVIGIGPRPVAAESLRPWMGVSSGAWDGDTLVVETTGFNRGESVRSLPYQLYLSPDARVVERFARISPHEILYGFSVDDPAIFTQVWRGEFAFMASQDRIFEYACHEGNYSLPNILAGARRADGR